jgi:hypothetical protein
MAKFKPAKGRKQQAPPSPGAVSCLVLIAVAFILVFVVFYYAFKGG